MFGATGSKKAVPPVMSPLGRMFWPKVIVESGVDDPSSVRVASYLVYRDGFSFVPSMVSAIAYLIFPFAKGVMSFLLIDVVNITFVPVGRG